MSGHLSINPFVKSFDELTRSRKRMETYLNVNHHLLSSEQRSRVEGMIENLQQAINYIPDEFQVERYKRKA